MEEFAGKISGLQYFFYGKFKLWIHFINHRSTQVVSFILGEFSLWFLSNFHFIWVFKFVCLVSLIVLLPYLLLMLQTSVMISLLSFVVYVFCVPMYVWFASSIFCSLAVLLETLQLSKNLVLVSLISVSWFSISLISALYYFLLSACSGFILLWLWIWCLCFNISITYNTFPSKHWL